MKPVASRGFRAARAPWVTYGGRALSVGLLLAMAAAAADASEPRRIITLDGTWQVEQGGMESPPEVFSHTVAVPGLLDMAQPAFAEVGRKSAERAAFWYRRTFRLDGPLPAVAVLKVSKAMFGSRAILNGTLLGDHPGSFAPHGLTLGPRSVRERMSCSSAWGPFAILCRSRCPRAGTTRRCSIRPASSIPSN